MDLTNTKYGKLTVTARIGSDKNGQSLFQCSCDCGKEKIVLGNSLKTKLTQSCGCLQSPDIIGRKFGKLLVVNKITKTQYTCQCECGVQKVIKKKHLLGGNTKSCGCLRSGNTIFINRDEPRISTALAVYRQSYKDGDLSFDDFLLLSQQSCNYCGDPPTNTYNIFKNKKKKTIFAIENGNFTYNGLDRINSSIPHNLNNSVPCCKWCNYAKRERSVQDFVEHAGKIWNYHNKEKS
jgi:hypothetical protein